jgi:hypothetical protein
MTLRFGDRQDLQTSDNVSSSFILLEKLTTKLVINHETPTQKVKDCLVKVKASSQQKEGEPDVWITYLPSKRNTLEQ